MFESFKTFVSEFVDGEKHPSQFAENDYRLAAAALLVHAAPDTLDVDVWTDDGDLLARARGLTRTAERPMLSVVTWLKGLKPLSRLCFAAIDYIEDPTTWSQSCGSRTEQPFRGRLEADKTALSRYRTLKTGDSGL